MASNENKGGTPTIHAAPKRQIMADLMARKTGATPVSTDRLRWQHTFEAEEEPHGALLKGPGNGSRRPDAVPLSSDPEQSININVPKAGSRSGMVSRESVAADLRRSIEAAIPQIVDLLDHVKSGARAGGAEALAMLSEQGM
jgi:hypothetical protein